MNPLMLASLFLPVFGSGWQTLQSRRANRANQQTQREALRYSDRTQRGLNSQLGSLSNNLLSSNTGINNQLLYGVGGGPQRSSGVRGARRRADGSTPGDMGVGGSLATGSIEDVARAMANGATREQAIAAFNGPQSQGNNWGGYGPPQDLQGYQGRYQAAMDEFNRGRSELLSGFNDRIGRTMGMLDTFGNNAKADLARQYQGEVGGITQDAASRGLTNSTVLGAMRLGAQRQRDQSTRAIDEQINTQKAGAYQTLTGDLLNSYGNLLSNGLNLRTGLSGDFLGALDATNARQQALQQQLGMAQLGLGERGMDRRLGIMQGYPAQGPSPGNPFDAASAGLNNYYAYQASRPQQNNSWFGPAAVGGGFNLASAGLLGSFLR